MCDVKPDSDDCQLADDEDYEYDVYWFWPSRNNTQLSARDNFVHSRVRYNNHHGSEVRLHVTQSVPHSTSPNYRADNMKSLGYSKLFSAGFFLTKVNGFAEKVRGRIQRKHPASIC